MHTLLGKLGKNGFLYAFIGLFVVGGVALVSVKGVSAAVLLDNSLLGDTYTQPVGEQYLMNCYAGGYCAAGGTPLSTIYFSQIAYVRVNVSSGTIGGSILFWKPDGSNCAPTSATWTNISGNIWEYPVVGCSGVYMGFGIYTTSPPLVMGGSISNQGTTWLGQNASQVGTGSFAYQLCDSAGCSGGFSGAPIDLSTHFISVSPENGTTTATTSPVGAHVWANAKDFPNYGRVHVHGSQDTAFLCTTISIFRCDPNNNPAQSSFDIDLSTTTLDHLIDGDYNLSQSHDFVAGGRWTLTYDIQQVSYPWYFLGFKASYNTLVSTTTHITIGQLSATDIQNDQINAASTVLASTTRSGIGAILASTTASLASACNIFYGFSPGDCVTLIVWPGNSAMADNFTIIKQTPPWAYAFRIIDLLNATTSTTTLPAIDYSFASTSPMAVMGDIHFDPFGSVAQAGTLIGEMHSDQAGAPTVWTILMPIVNIFVYMVLIFMIIHDLTGIHWGGDTKVKHDETHD